LSVAAGTGDSGSDRARASAGGEAPTAAAWARGVGGTPLRAETGLPTDGSPAPAPEGTRPQKGELFPPDWR